MAAVAAPDLAVLQPHPPPPLLHPSRVILAGHKLETSTDGTTWKTVAEGKGSGTATRITFAPVRAKLFPDHANGGDARRSALDHPASAALRAGERTAGGAPIMSGPCSGLEENKFMATRREFMAASAAEAAAIAARPLYAWQGANNKIRMGVIGCGNRAGRVFNSLSRHDDCVFVAGAEVNDARLAGFMTPARQSFNLAMVKDYRRLLERQDIDAVLIGTPDFSHAKIMVDAIAAGKHLYAEKPASNSITRINAMLDAYNKSNRVVQVGTQQRSWDHFIEAKKLMDTGILGVVSHVVICQPNSYARVKEDAQPVPAGLDWDMWQMNAKAIGATPRRAGPAIQAEPTRLPCVV